MPRDNSSRLLIDNSLRLPTVFAITSRRTQKIGYGSANRRMSFGSVKTSVKIAVLIALNISSLGAGTKYDCR